MSVDVPSADRDTPGWIKVGIIAVVGFAVGVAWPRVTGVRLGPNPPGETASNARASSPEASQAAATKAAVAKATVAPKGAPGAAAGSVSPVASSATRAVGAAGTGASSNAAAVVGAAVEDAPASRIRVQRGAVLSCRTSGGDTKKGTRECGALPSLDAYVAPRIRKLSTCAAAAEASGKLSLVVGADFATDKITWEIGKSTTIAPVDGVRSCLDALFKGATASGIAHEHARYTVAYASTLGDAARSGAEATDDGDKRARTAQATDDGERTARARDESTIRWENATVRDAPRTGQIIAQLPRGTKVKLGTAKDGWYPVKFGDGFAREGWIHRSAFGSP